MKRDTGLARAFDALLVANRGEIACRILRTARAFGLRTIAVHGPGERDAPHATLADEAIELHADTDLAGYLSIDAIVGACLRSGAGAVHPGYGFLSESAAFARACEAAGIVFVGPPAQAIEALGDKAHARALAERIGVPCLPGGGDGTSVRELAIEAERIGTPLMIKAAAGGGGRGMRRVDALDAFVPLCEAAAKEAESAFGDGRLLLERYVAGARHIEIQILADRFGACVHLGERDCSTQRRHQKIVEEAPAPDFSPQLRAAMGDAAVRLMREAGYVGAGTVEFLLAPGGEFHFLEVNTRLQVEHRVTEAITGIDLVEMQLRIARGDPLPFAQDELRFEGHAIEARLCAEDAFGGFVPQSGAIAGWRIDGDEGVLVDHALGSGTQVLPQFDSLLAKFVAHGRDRAQARLRLVAALERSSILGLITNRNFLLECLRSARFVDAGLDTDWLMNAAATWRAPSVDASWQAVASALRVHAEAERHGSLASWSSTGVRRSQVSLALPGTGAIADTAGAPDGATLRWDATVIAIDDGLVVRIGANEIRVRLDLPDAVHIDGRRRPIHVAFAGAHQGPFRAWLEYGGVTACVVDTASLAAPRAAAEARTEVRAGMHGRITALAVREGDRVRAGQTLLSIEAMKMEHHIAAPQDGLVAALAVAPGAQVSPATLLARIEADSATQP